MMKCLGGAPDPGGFIILMGDETKRRPMRLASAPEIATSASGLRRER
jgi:hypothetical protein